MNLVTISEIVRTHYGIGVHKFKSLAGYIDKNFLISAADGSKYILKCSTSDPLYFIKAQNQVLIWLQESRHENQVHLYPEVIFTKEGKEVVTLSIEGKSYTVRLLTYLEGVFLGEVPEPSNELYKNLGFNLGHLDMQLSHYHVPELSHLELDWDIQNTLECLSLVKYIQDVERSRVIQYFLLQYKEQVLPQVSSLRKSIIHNDANPMNVLVDAATQTKVVGIIDFGDMVYSCTIFEVAIALSYLMMDVDDPLSVAKVFLKAYHVTYPLEEREIGLLYYLVAARLCRSLVMAAHSTALDPSNSYTNRDADAAGSLLNLWLTINPVKAENCFRDACGFEGIINLSSNLLVKERQLYISTSQSISYDAPIVMRGAALQYMYDDTGLTYLDCVNNIMHVGHCHPGIVIPAQKQMALLNTNTRYLYPSLNSYAQKLLASLPDSLDKVFFVNSGSAATDLALRIANLTTGHNDVLIIDQGYHGNTAIGIDVSAYKFDGKGGAGVKPHVHKLCLPDVYRDSRSGHAYSLEVDAIVSSLEGHKLSAFIGESILSCGGQLMLPEGYLEAVYAKVRAAGGLCIADEVQVGFGRVGEAFWGFELQGVVPDIVIMGKPIGNGHPMAAVATTSKIAEAFDNGMEFFSSFGGNPVSCVIGEAVLDIIEHEQLQCHAKIVGDYLLKTWRVFMSKFNCIGDVRGAGLFLGIEIVSSKVHKTPDATTATYIVNSMKDRGYLLSTDGPYHNVIKFKPPMIFTMANGEALCTDLEEVLVLLEPR